MPTALEQVLEAFTTEHGFKGKGPLCVTLVVTGHAREKGLPLDSEALVTGGGGRVLSLGWAGVQSVLNRHGIKRVLAAEGGRTSRGSLQNMRHYVAFLNDAHLTGIAAIDGIEAYWIRRVRAFSRGNRSISILTPLVACVTSFGTFSSKPSCGRRLCPASTTPARWRSILWARNSIALWARASSSTTATRQRTPRDAGLGNFLVGDVAVHVTTAPGEAVIERCRANLDSGCRPVLVTLRNGVAVAEGLAGHKGLGDRIDMFEIEQFVALNLYELGGFAPDGRRDAVEDLVNAYDEIIDVVETNPSLRIQVRK